MKGFTVLEMILAGVIIGILATVSLPRFADIALLRQDAAASRLKADLRFVQSLALSSQTVHGLNFNSQGYTAYYRSGLTQVTIKNPADAKSFVVDYGQDSNFAGLSINSSSLSGGYVEFDAKGIPKDAGSYFSTPTKSVVIQTGSGSRTLAIRRETGYVQ